MPMEGNTQMVSAVCAAHKLGMSVNDLIMYISRRFRTRRVDARRGIPFDMYMAMRRDPSLSADPVPVPVSAAPLDWDVFQAG